MEFDSSPSSQKQKPRSPICLSSCFRGADDDRQPSTIRCSSTWLRSKAQELPELKEKCWGLVARIGKQRRHSGDFRYDPPSYALNFDEGADDDAYEEFRHRNFSSRLPASPPPASRIAAAR